METTATYFLTRLLLQKGLALIYLIAFVAILHQFKPLLGENGLLPVHQFVKIASFWQSPSIFFWIPKDAAFMTLGWVGVVLAIFAILGFSEKFGNGVSMAVWALLWVLYLSYVNVGQTFYAFGWESLLLEAGFYAIFLGSASSAPSIFTIFLMRWLLFRLMFGAGLIKIRGDECWRDFTCLNYHYETQPIPNPFSWYFHWLPKWFHGLSVFWNHIVELVVPFMYFLPQPFAAIAGIITFSFHGWLMASGNFAFLGFLTMVLSVSTIPDKFLRYALPLGAGTLSPPSTPYLYAVYAVTALVLLLSYFPVKNLLSSRQIMNFSFNPLHLVGTYGAFGSITRPRYEVIVEGTSDSEITPKTKWQEYEFIGKPGGLFRRPPQIAPYHLRLDWLMWFQPFRAQVTERGVAVYGYDPWFVHFMAKLLQGDKGILSLIRKNPFPEKPPRFVRALFYEYHFTTPEEKKKTGAWWRRELKGFYFPAVSLDMPEFRQILHDEGWLD